jgi:putative ABC transport system permease protein
VRALGASSQQVSVGLAVAQVVSALPGAIIGIPAGIGLFKAVSRGSSVSPSTLWLAATLLGTLLVVAGLTIIPARVAARIPASQILQSEAS